MKGSSCFRLPCNMVWEIGNVELEKRTGLKFKDGEVDCDIFENCKWLWFRNWETDSCLSEVLKQERSERKYPINRSFPFLKGNSFWKLIIFLFLMRKNKSWRKIDTKWYLKTSFYKITQTFQRTKSYLIISFRHFSTTSKKSHWLLSEKRHEKIQHF